MRAREMKISGAIEFVPDMYPDERGRFVAPFQEQVFSQASGRRLRVAQTNHSQSRRGVIRGLHFADVPPGQAKYIYCASGSFLDVVVDLRVGSPTFGQWDSTLVRASQCNAIFIAEGLGHALMALEDDTVALYLCSEGYNPSAERAINPLDPELGLPWPADIVPILSEKDRTAPSLAQAVESEVLPRYAECLTWYAKQQLED